MKGFSYIFVFLILCKQSIQQFTNESVVNEGDVELIPTIEAVEISDGYTHQVTVSYGCPVNSVLPCISKCCDLFKAHANLGKDPTSPHCVTPTEAVDFAIDFIDLPNFEINKSAPFYNSYEIYIGDPCVQGKYILEPELHEMDKYSLYSNGTLFQNGKFYPLSDYCVDNVDGKIRAFLCFESTLSNPFEFYHILYPVGQLLSIPFLIATAVIYSCYESIRDTPGKALICHVSSLAMAFFILALVQLTGHSLNGAVCTGAAFIIQFFFVACFFWLNVLCYDSYRQFTMEYRAQEERKRFIMYSLYAWNAPLILFIVSLVIDIVPGLPDSFIRPGFGAQSCWFSSEEAALPYFFGPVGLVLAINAILFGLTAYEYYKREKAAHLKATRNSDQTRKNKLTFLLKNAKQSFKLFLTMGICWLAEVISWSIGGSRYIWITTDVINTLQGLLIFYFYVWEVNFAREKLIMHFRFLCNGRKKTPARQTEMRPLNHEP